MKNLVPVWTNAGEFVHGYNCYSSMNFQLGCIIWVSYR